MKKLIVVVIGVLLTGCLPQENTWIGAKFVITSINKDAVSYNMEAIDDHNNRVSFYSFNNISIGDTISFTINGKNGR